MATALPSEAPDFPPIRACLFDMDGLLIDSEDIYTKVTNMVLHEYGKPDLPWSVKAQLQGRPFGEATALLCAWAQLPIDQDEYTARIAALQKEHFPSCQPLPGVLTLLDDLSKAGVHLALATSSHARTYVLKTSHLATLFSYFPESQRVLGDDTRIGKGKGKPCPDIYLLAMETVNASLREKGEKEVTRDECLVFEDSVPGVEAGRRAGMRVVWCPHPGLTGEFRGREEEVLAGLIGSEGGEEGKVREVAEHVGAEKGLVGWPGRIDDGWGATVQSLQSFDYGKYGIGISKA